MVKDIAKLIARSKKVVALTGAGISTESGLPDFRSNGGMWQGKDVMKIAHEDTIRWQEGDTANSYVSRVIDFSEFYAWRKEQVVRHHPNVGHKILSKWQAKGIVSTIITQNVDGYHQQAGSTVLPIHGDIRTYHCSKCGMIHATIEPSFCNCGGVIRPDVVLFGETVQFYNEAIEETSTADLLLVLGTSLTVLTTSSLVFNTLRNNGEVVIINRDPTDHDSVASYVINDKSLGKTLALIDNCLSVPV